MKSLKKLSLALIALSSLACTLTFAQYSSYYGNNYYGGTPVPSTFFCPTTLTVNSHHSVFVDRFMTPRGVEWRWTRFQPLFKHDVRFFLANRPVVLAPNTDDFLSLKSIRLDSVSFATDGALICNYNAMVTRNGFFYTYVPVVLRSSSWRGDFNNCLVAGDRRVICPRP